MWRGTRPQVRGMIVITLVAGVALAAAESGHRGLGDQAAWAKDWAMDETTGSAGSSGDKAAPGELALSDEQRGRIYDSVMRMPDAPVAQRRRPRSPTRCRPAWRCRICPPPSPATFRSCRATNSRSSTTASWWSILRAA